MKRRENLSLQNNVTMYGSENKVVKKSSSSSSKSSSSSSSGGGGGWLMNAAYNTQRQNWDPGSYDWSKTTF